MSALTVALCGACGLSLAPSGSLCRFCVATDAYDAGRLSKEDYEAVMSDAAEEERRAWACTQCDEGEGGFVCDDCLDANYDAELEHQRAHSAAILSGGAR